jgi:type IV pilus assembly protein PilW
MQIKKIREQRFSQQTGISLIEIMVAMVISLFLLGGVMQVYMGNRITYRFSDATARIQENGRFAIETIATDVRMAGFWGCVTVLKENNIHIRNNLNVASSEYNSVLHDFIEMDAISSIDKDGLNNSDSLTIRGTKSGQILVVAPFMASRIDDIVVRNPTSIKENDIVMVSQCDDSIAADIFEVSKIVIESKTSTISHGKNGKIGNTNPLGCEVASEQCLSIAYARKSASISIFQTITYSIRTGASGEPALFRSESVTGNGDELIEGVEKMEILFGVDTNNDGTSNKYVAGSTVTDSTQVRAVRIFILVRSENNNITDKPQAYTLNGVTTTPKDNRLRQVFSITIALRNRV